MAIIAVGDVIEVRLFQSLPPQLGINIVHFNCTAIAGTSVTIAAFVDAYSTRVAAGYKPVMSANATYYGAGARRILPAPVTVQDFSANGRGVGTGVGGTLPEQVSGVITKRTALAGRANRGRIYVSFPYLNAVSVATGNVDPGYVTALGTLATAIDLDITVVVGANSATLTHVLYHRGPGTIDSVVTCVAQSKWGTQRRRGNYGRTNVLPF